MKGDWSLLLPVLLPMLAGVLSGMWQKLRKQRIGECYTAAVVALTAVLALRAMANGGELQLWEFVKGVPLYFKVDRLGCVFAAITVVMWLCSTFFSFPYLAKEEEGHRYQSFSLLALGSLLGVCF